MNPEMLKPWWWSLPLLSNLPRIPRQSSRAEKTHLRDNFFSRERGACKRLIPRLFKKMSLLLSCKPLRTIPQQFVAPEENNFINRNYCQIRSADYKNLIFRLIPKVTSHNNQRLRFCLTSIANMGPARGWQA